jgi:predicted TIM-barrel fold metal-dependent hydrolase
MKIIDAHHHLWAPQTPALDIGYGWLKDIGAMKPFGDPTAIQRDYLIGEFLAELAPDRLLGSVHVQADPKIPDPVKETAFVQKMSDDSGHPIMMAAYVDLASRGCANQIAGHKAYKNMRGIRQILSYLPDRPELSFAATNLLDDPVWRENFATLAEHSLSFDLMLYPEQMQQAAAFLAEHPGVPVVVNHLGSPYDKSDAGLAQWREGMAALAQLGHVKAKLSGYAMYFLDDLSGVPQKVTADILALFGADRVMFGSNFPVDKLHLTYRQVFDFVRSEAGQEAEQAVFYDNVRRFYRFDEVEEVN